MCCCQNTIKKVRLLSQASAPKKFLFNLNLNYET